MIDINFDVRQEAITNRIEKDPDVYSPTLRRYHYLLWNKSLPNGTLFDLKFKKPYLVYEDSTQKIDLASDSITHTYKKWKRTQDLIKNVPPVILNEFYALACTVGGYIIFPKGNLNGFRSINQVRGMSKFINDRFDLTLECIRRFYIGEISPLSDVLKNNSHFFDLFQDFKGYIDFFLLQDLVSKDYKNINFFLPFKDFKIGTLPKNLGEYTEYAKNNIEFLNSRNERILKYSQNLKSNDLFDL